MQKLLSVQSLTGQARNPTSGQVDKDLLPERVFNLAPERMGGYAPFGRRVRAMAFDGAPLELPDLGGLIGADETGIASFVEGGAFALYRGDRVYQQVGAQPVDGAVHLDAAGAYRDRNAFLVLSRELAGVRVPVQPLANATATVTTGVGSPMSNGETGFGENAVEVAYGNGTFLAITSGAVWRRTASGAWEEVHRPSGGGAFTRLSYGAGVWLAAQGGSDSSAARVWRSSDDGDSWASATLPVLGRVTFIAETGGNWMAGTYRSVESREYTVRSMDGGTSWIDGTNRGQHSVLADAAVYGPFLVIPEVHPKDHGRGDVYVARTDQEYWWVYHRWAAGFPINRDAYRVNELAHRVALTADNHLVVISRDGRVSAAILGNFSAGPYTLPGTAFQDNAGVSGESGVQVNDLAYDPVGNALIAVGGVGGEARAWRSTDNGRSWTRLTDVETAIQGPIISVAADGQGDALYLGSNRWAHSGATRGLEGGQYNVYVVSYFNTHAGRFVYDLHRETVTTEDGGRIVINAPDRASILADNSLAAGGWITPEYEGILEDLRFDVYVQRVGEEIAGEAPEYTIRYAFTEPFPEPGKTVNRSLDALPLGRQLLLHGAPTTAVFEKGITALHNGRVWGMASQDEARWPGDVASPEIANQAQRFVLAYSEVGWANLISDRSFIPIQPTQSQHFTGLVSTPMGLLVMFEHEIYLVTGDPAFGNVTVELYLDLVGNDVGSRPAKVGGVPFVVWNGKVWALQAGQAQSLAPDQWLRDDPFVRIAPEPQTRSLLALTASGRVFRYLLDERFWFTDPASQGAPVAELLANCTCGTGDNTRFVDEEARVWSTRRDGVPDVPHLLYQGIDFGEPTKRHALYMVKFGVEEYRTPLRGEPGFDPGGVPVLYYQAERSDNTLAEGLPDIGALAPFAWGGRLPYSQPRVRARGGAYAWRLPLAETRGSSIDVRLELRGMDYGDVLRLPLELTYASGGALR